MAITIDKIEQESNKDSIIHKLDGRIKLILTILVIVYAVYTTDFLVLLLLEMYLIILLLFSKVSIGYFVKRVLIILPFGGFIALFQPFIHPGLILPYTLPFGLTITYEGIIFGALLLARLLVCLSAIVLLSSVTPIETIVSSMRKLGFPKEMSMILSMTVRYIFVFFEELDNILKAQKSRSFNIWNNKTSYLWRIKQMGYTIVMLFLNSFEKGERVYYSMLSRGYVGEATSLKQEPPIMYADYTIIILTILFISSVEIVNLLWII
jgi:cobalt/nickel transport system permease protein